MSNLTCPFCGADVTEGQRFCANCGTRLHTADADRNSVQHRPGGGQPDPFAVGAADTGYDDFFSEFHSKGSEGAPQRSDEALPTRRSRRRFNPDVYATGPVSTGGAEDAGAGAGGGAGARGAAGADAWAPQDTRGAGAAGGAGAGASAGQDARGAAGSGSRADSGVGAARQYGAADSAAQGSRAAGSGGTAAGVAGSSAGRSNDDPTFTGLIRGLPDDPADRPIHSPEFMRENAQPSSQVDPVNGGSAHGGTARSDRGFDGTAGEHPARHGGMPELPALGAAPAVPPASSTPPTTPLVPPAAESPRSQWAVPQARGSQPEHPAPWQQADPAPTQQWQQADAQPQWQPPAGQPQDAGRDALPRNDEPIFSDLFAEFGDPEERSRENERESPASTRDWRQTNRGAAAAPAAASSAGSAAGSGADGYDDHVAGSQPRYSSEQVRQRRRGVSIILTVAILAFAVIVAIYGLKPLLARNNGATNADNAPGTSASADVAPGVNPSEGNPGVVPSPTAAPSETTTGPFDPVTFSSGSGNIRCQITTETGVACMMGTFDFAAPKDSCFNGSTGIAVGVNEQGAVHPCLSKNLGGGQTLDYDTPITAGPYTCSINFKTGVTCTNGTGDGFTMEYSAGIDIKGNMAPDPRPKVDPVF